MPSPSNDNNPPVLLLRRTTTSNTTTVSPKRVQFCEDRNVHYDNKVFCREDGQTWLWYSRLEFETFRQSTLELATALVRADRKLRQASAERSCHQNYPHHQVGGGASFSSPISSLSYAAIVNQAYIACCRARSDAEDEVALLQSAASHRLKLCVQLSVTRLGLEHLTLPLLQKSRLLRRQELLEHVERIQRLHRNDPSRSSARRDEALRLVSQRISRPSRLFAIQTAAPLP